jgi:hypothetical protein
MSVSNVTRLPPLARLESGDHLTAEEFLNRYEAAPRLKKAELIDGVVYLPSPTRWGLHAIQHQALSTWLGVYWAHTRGTQAGHSGTLRMDLKNVPQPDAALIVLPSHGGQVEIDENQYIVGGPELVGEISGSTRSIDVNSKPRVYLRNRVREYIVWRVEDEAIDWFVEREGNYERLASDVAGVVRSLAFPGLWLDCGAMTTLDLLGVLRVLEQGIASEEHTAFVARLARTAAASQETP